MLSKIWNNDRTWLFALAIGAPLTTVYLIIEVHYHLSFSDKATVFWITCLSVAVPCAWYFLVRLSLAERDRIRVRAHIDRARQAYGEKDWFRVISELESLDKLGYARDVDLFFLGTTCAKVGRWPKALTAFERIRLSLEDRNLEAKRICNHAICLCHLSRPDDAHELLTRADCTDWSLEDLERRNHVMRLANDSEPELDILH